MRPAPERQQEYSDDETNRLISGEKADSIIDEHAQIREVGQYIIGKLRESDTFNTEKGGFYLNSDGTRDVLRRVNTFKSLEEAEQYKAEFEEKYKEITTNIRTYFGGIDSHRNLFGKRSGVDTAKEYKEQFVKQDLQEQKRWLEELDTEISSLETLREELQQLTGSAREHEKEFAKLRRHEKREQYLPQLKSNIESYEQLLAKQGVARKDRDQKMRLFKESSLKRQQEILKGERVEAGEEKTVETKSIDQEFKDFSKTRQRKYPLFNKLTLHDKQKAIETLRLEVKQEFTNKFESSPYLSALDKEDCRKVVTGNFKIAMAELCLRYFEKNEAQARKTIERSIKYPVEIRDQYKFDTLRFIEKEKALKEMEKHSQLHQKYQKKVQKMVKDRLLAEKSAPLYIKWYLELNLADKTRFSEGSELDTRKSERKDSLKKFEKLLPKPVQKEFEKTFYEGDLDQRIRLVNFLLHANETYNAKYEQKLNRMGKKNILAKKSVDSYLRWFKIGLTLSKKARLAIFDPDLETPERQVLLDHFNALPKEIRDKIRTRFSEGTRRERRTLLEKYSPDKGVSMGKELDLASKTHNLLVKHEIQGEKHTLLRLAEKFEIEEKYDLAAKIYEQILEIDPSDTELQKRLVELKALDEQSKEEENPLVTAAIFESMQDSTLYEALEEQTVLQIYAEHIEKSQRISGTQKAEDRVGKTLEGEKQKLHEDLVAQTGGKYFLNREGKAEKHEKLRVDRMERRDVSRLREPAKRLQGDKDKRVDTVDLVMQDGRILAHQEFLKMLADRRDNLKTRIASRAGKKLGDKKINEKEIVKAIRDEDLELKL